MPVYSSHSSASQASDAPTYPELAEKRVLITGASVGIGAGIARAFARQGCRLVLHFNSHRDEMYALADEIGRQTAGIRVFQCDFAGRDAISRFARGAISAFHGIDIVINNAGIVPKNLAMATNAEDFEEIVGINLRAPYLLSTAAAERMRNAGRGGTIINVSSIHAGKSSERMALYAMTKGALERMTEVQAVEWGEYGIRVNAIAPGATMVERNRESFCEHEDAWMDVIPRGRFGQVEDISGAALWMCSDQAQWMTGTTLTVDGGQMARGNYPDL